MLEFPGCRGVRMHLSDPVIAFGRIAAFCLCMCYSLRERIQVITNLVHTQPHWPC